MNFSSDTYWSYSTLQYIGHNYIHVIMQELMNL